MTIPKKVNILLPKLDKSKSLKSGMILTVLIFLILGVSISVQSILAAWTGPTATPPINNVSDLLISGKIGVGTINPGAKLDVVGLIRNSAPSAGTIELSGLLPGYSDNIYPTLKTSGQYLYFSVNGRYTGYMGDGGVLGMYNTSASNNVQLSASGASWLNGGNVGIGTINPGQKLQVEGNIQAQRIKFPGVGGNSGVSGDYYSIYQEAGPWSSPYPDLVIQYHTGIKYDAYQGYGGHQFYTDYNGTGNPTGLKMQITDKVYVNDVCTTPGGKCLSTTSGGGCKRVYFGQTVQSGNIGGGTPSSGVVSCGTQYYATAVIDTSGYAYNPGVPPSVGYMICCGNSD